MTLSLSWVTQLHDEYFMTFLQTNKLSELLLPLVTGIDQSI